MTLEQARKFLADKKVFVKDKSKEIQKNFLVLVLNGLSQMIKKLEKIYIFYFFLRI